MDITRSEIVKGVWLDCIPDSSASFISINLLYAPDRDNSAFMGLLPYVLCCGTAQYPLAAELEAVKDKLGGIKVSPLVRRFGEVYSCGIKMDIPESCPDVKSAVSLLCSFFISPATKGGLLIHENVDSQKELVAESIDALDNDYIRYANQRCLDEMCCYEDYSVPYLGDSSEIGSVYYTRLTKHFRSVLQTCPIEIIYSGNIPAKQIKRFLREALSVMPRGEINYEIGSDIRMNAVEEDVRKSVDYDEESRCRYVLGCRIGECMDDPDFPAISLYSALAAQLALDSGLENVSADIDMHKGLFLIGFDGPSGKEDEYFSAVTGIIGKLSQAAPDSDTLQKSAQSESEKYISIAGNPDKNEEFLFSTVLLGLDCTANEYAQAVAETDANSVFAVAQSIEPDMFTVCGIPE